MNEDDALKSVSHQVYNMQLQGNKNIAKMKEFLSGINKGMSELYELNKKWEEEDKKRKGAYLTWLREKTNGVKSPDETLKFILGEKKRVTQHIIEAKIKKDGYQRKYFEELIADVIDPFLSIVQQEFDIYSKLPNEAVSTVTAKSIPPAPKVKSTTGTENVKPDPVELPAGFCQIDVPATKDEILKHFMVLSKVTNVANKLPYMEGPDVQKFAERNFKIFGKNPIGGYIPLNMTQRQKGILLNLVLEFYLKYEPIQKNTKRKYADLLIWNFEIFKGDNPINLLKNMGSKKRGKEYIDIKKYL